MSALQDGVITRNTVRNDPGYWRLPNSKTRPFRDWKAWGHGKVEVLKSIEESVDTFYYQIAYDMGIDRLSTWMNKFGFGDYTGIDIYEESKANMPTREWKVARYRTPWYQGDTIPVGIGQGYWTATPMQIAKATTVLVNHGKVYPPHLLRAIVNDGKEEVIPVEPYPPIQGVSERNWDTALKGMELVNHGKTGTARRAFHGAPYLSGGKSGTARYLAWERTKNTTRKRSQNTCVTTPCLPALHRLNTLKPWFRWYWKTPVAAQATVRRLSGRSLTTYSSTKTANLNLTIHRT